MEEIKIVPSKIFDSPYYSLNKKLLTFLGLWPSLGRARKTVSLIVFSVIVMSLIIPILAGFRLVWGVNMVYVIENCIGFLYLVAIYSKYVSAYWFQDRIQLVYKQTVVDWKSVSDKDELKILHKYSRMGRLLTIIFVGYSGMAVCVFNIFPYITPALDRFMPLENVTRQRIYPYHPDYFFIDSDKHFFKLFTFHGIYVVAFSTLAVAAVDSMMVANIMHACGLFAIVCHRLENIGKTCGEEAENLQLVDDRQVYRDCKLVCQLHLSSINTVEKIQNSFSISFLIVMGCGMAAIAMLMFDMMCSLGDILRLGIILSFLFGIKICLFYLNWVVQQLINSSEEVFKYAYCSCWYNLSVNSRKMIGIILQNSMKPIALSAASICDLNLEIFASVVKTSMSYCTVMLSMSQQ